MPRGSFPPNGDTAQLGGRDGSVDRMWLTSLGRSERCSGEGVLADDCWRFAVIVLQELINPFAAAFMPRETLIITVKIAYLGRNLR